MLGLWQKGHWTWILEVVLLPPSRVTLDKSPSAAALGRPWPGGFLSTTWLALAPGAGLSSWVHRTLGVGPCREVTIPCLALEESVSDLGEAGTAGPPTRSCDH